MVCRYIAGEEKGKESGSWRRENVNSCSRKCQSAGKQDRDRHNAQHHLKNIRKTKKLLNLSYVCRPLKYIIIDFITEISIFNTLTTTKYYSWLIQGQKLVVKI